jgi:hypothetical protein
MEGETEHTRIPDGPRKSAKARQGSRCISFGTSLCAVSVAIALTSSHPQHGRLGRSITEASSVQIVSGHTGKVDDNPTFFIGHEESLTLFGRVLSVDGICYVGVDDEGSDGLFRMRSVSRSARAVNVRMGRKTRRRRRRRRLTLTLSIFSKLGIESTMLFVHSCLMAIPAQ